MEENKWSKWFYYDETSPTCLRWAVEVRSGRHYSIVERQIGDVAGSVKCDGEHSSVKLKSVSYLVHCVIWEMFNGAISENLIVDHFDMNPLNNRISNLRMIKKAINNRNQKLRSDNTTGTTGVVFTNGCWKACWKTLSGDWKQRSFSVNKYGFSVARSLAITTRASEIANLNRLGAGYTEGHGK